MLTTAIGATVLAVPVIRDLWAATYPTMDSKWITPGDSWGYWLMVWAPLPVSGAAAWWFYPRVRRVVSAAERLLAARVDVLAATLVGVTLCAYCFINLGVRGYLGVSLLSSELIGIYRENIGLRSEMFEELGTPHFAAIYMGIPAVAIVAFCNAVRTRQLRWWALFAAAVAGAGGSVRSDAHQVEHPHLRDRGGGGGAIFWGSCACAAWSWRWWSVSAC